MVRAVTMLMVAEHLPKMKCETDNRTGITIGAEGRLTGVQYPLYLHMSPRLTLMKIL